MIIPIRPTTPYTHHQTQRRQYQRYANIHPQRHPTHLTRRNTHHNHREHLYQRHHNLRIPLPQIYNQRMATLCSIPLSILHILNYLPTQIRQKRKHTIPTHHIPYPRQRLTSRVRPANNPVYRREIRRHHYITSQRHQQRHHYVTHQKLPLEMRRVEPQYHRNPNEHQQKRLPTQHIRYITPRKHPHQGQHHMNQQCLPAAHIPAHNNPARTVHPVRGNVKIIINRVTTTGNTHRSQHKQHEQSRPKPLRRPNSPQLWHYQPILQQHLEYHHSHQIRQPYQPR